MQILNLYAGLYLLHHCIPIVHSLQDTKGQQSTEIGKLRYVACIVNYICTYVI